MRKWTYPYLAVLAEQVWKMNEIFRSPVRTEVRKAELQIFGSKDRAELRKQSSRPLKVMEEQKYGIFNFISLAVKSKQKRGTELHVFGSPGRDEMRKWTYPYLEDLAEQVRKMNEIFRSPGRLKVRNAELQIFGGPGRAEVRKRKITSLEVPAEMKCASGLTHIWKSWQNKYIK